MALRPLRVKDKSGVKFIEFEEGKQYVMLLSKDNADSLFRNPMKTTQLMKELHLAYIFIAVDINKVTLEEKEQFARHLLEGEPKNEQTKEI